MKIKKKAKFSYEKASLFLIIILIGTSLTPFAYSIKPAEQQTDKLNLFVKIGAGGEACKDKVWIDKLDWNEYHKLVNDTITQVDAFGNKEAGEREQNMENAGIPSNPDAIGMDKQYIPGVDGKPALLYDVIGKKAVNTNDYCYLNNLVTTGRISYATRLKGFIRYCSNNSAECEQRITKDEQSEIEDAIKNELKPLKEQIDKDNPDWEKIKENINKYKNENTQFKEALSQTNLIKELDKTEPDKATVSKEMANLGSVLVIKQASTETPESYVESPSIELTVNADQFLLSPKTLQNWLAFLKSFASLDTVVTAMNVLNMASIGRGGKGAAEVIEGAETAAKAEKVSWVTKWGRRLFGTTEGVNAGRATELMKIGEAAEMDAQVLKNAERIAKATEELKGVNKADEILSILKKRSNTIREAIEDTNKGLSKNIEELEKIKNPSNEVKSLIKQQKDILKDGESLVKRLEVLEGGSNTITDPSLFVGAINKFEEGVKNLKNPSRSWEWYEKMKALETAGSLKGKVGVKVFEFIQAVFQSKFLNPLKLMIRFQKVTWITYGLMWINDQALRQPIYESNGALMIINEKTTKTAHMREAQSYLDIKKTVDSRAYAQHLSGLVDTFWNLIGVKTESKLTRKLKTIQDIVFIYDQDAYASKITGNNPINIVSSPLETGSEWKFFSTVNDKAVVYNFEHPNGYKGGGKYSALAFEIKNINLGAVIAESSNKFNTPLTGPVRAIGVIRDLIGATMLFSFAPASATAAVTTAGKVFYALPAMAVAGVSTYGVIKGAFPMYTQEMYDITQETTANVNSLEEIYDNPDATLCSDAINKGTFGDKNAVTALKWAIAATAFISLVASDSGIGKPIGIVSDLINMGLSWKEEKIEEEVNEKLSNCVETEFDAVAYKDMLSDTELQQNSAQALQPLQEEMFNLMGSMSPQATEALQSITTNIVQNTLSVTGELYDKNIVTTTGKEIYNIHFKDGAIKWFQSDNCKIQLCQQEEGTTRYKCDTQQGYMLYDENGELVLDGAPQALSLYTDFETGNMNIVQKVIEIAKDSENPSTQFEITKDGIKVKSTCLKSNIKKLLGLTGDNMERVSENDIDSKIETSLGNLEAIYTEDANLWFDENGLLSIQFTKDTGSYAAGEIQRVKKAKIEFENTNNGLMKITGDDGYSLSLELGSKGVISFKNGMLRSGLIQTKEDGDKVDFSNQFHLFIYGLTEFTVSDINSINISDYCNEDGTLNGVKLQADLALGDLDASQVNNVLSDICFSEFETANGGHVSIRNGQLCIQKPNGEEECTDVTETDEGLKAADGSIWKIENGPNGPEWWQYINGKRTGNPLPILNMNGLGGSWTTGADGRISIKNTFPFALNPSFNQYGAGGLGLMTPQLPPWGGRVEAKQATQGTGGQGTQNNVIAQLPGLPENPYWFALFIITLISSLIIIRIKYSDEEVKQIIKKQE